MTVFVTHPGHVFEVGARLTSGKFGQGCYSILHASAVPGGHINLPRLATACCLSMLFMKRESHCRLFFDAPGRGRLFGVYGPPKSSAHSGGSAEL